jgi:AraC-like DNA-binding protein
MASSLAAPLGTVTLLHDLMGGAPQEPIALEVTFQHPPAPESALSELKELLACPVRFNAEATRLTLRGSILDCPLRAPNPGLFDYLGRHAAELQRRVQSAATVSARVRELVAAHVREGEPAQASVARRLGMSERTLQRRLNDEGVAFATLVEEVRAELARLYLGDPKLAVFEVAFLLGYSEPSAFNRAFRRWTGMSPSQFRTSTRTEQISPG